MPHHQIKDFHYWCNCLQYTHKRSINNLHNDKTRTEMFVSEYFPKDANILTVLTTTLPTPTITISMLTCTYSVPIKKEFLAYTRCSGVCIIRYLIRLFSLIRLMIKCPYLCTQNVHMNDNIQ